MRKTGIGICERIQAIFSLRSYLPLVSNNTVGMVHRKRNHLLPWYI